MEAQNTAELNNSHKNKVHRILAHSYSINLILFLAGVCLDLIFHFDIFTNPIVLPIGIVLLVLGSILIVWAQASTRNISKDTVTKETFSSGPYRFARHPTHWGLFLLIIGFGLMINAMFVVFSTVISFWISKFTFLKKQEEVLAAKYGAPYLEYKQSVKF